jgi:hypothetical protein
LGGIFGSFWRPKSFVGRWACLLWTEDSSIVQDERSRSVCCLSISQKLLLLCVAKSLESLRPQMRMSPPSPKEIIDGTPVENSDHNPGDGKETSELDFGCTFNGTNMKARYVGDKLMDLRRCCYGSAGETWSWQFEGRQLRCYSTPHTKHDNFLSAPQRDHNVFDSTQHNTARYATIEDARQRSNPPWRRHHPQVARSSVQDAVS